MPQGIANNRKKEQKAKINMSDLSQGEIEFFEQALSYTLLSELLIAASRSVLA
jgi:hypothetical protein